LPNFRICAYKNPYTMATSTLSLANKEAYFTPILNNYTHNLCKKFSVRSPLECWKRTEGGKGVYEVYFANDAHMRYFCHKVYGTEMNADTSTLTEAYFGALDDDVKVQVTGPFSIPMHLTWEFPSFNALIDKCYDDAQAIEEELKQEAEIEAQSVAAAALVPLMQANNNNFVADIQRQINHWGAMDQQHFKHQRQMMGSEPTHYIDGVPNYVSSVADAFRK